MTETAERPVLPTGGMAGHFVREARAWLAARLHDGANCPTCGQRAQVYRRKLTSSTAKTLIKIWRATREVEINPDYDGFIHVPTLLKGAIADEAKARYWNLIEPMPDVKRDDGSTRTGWWRLTDIGRKFVVGEVSIAKYVELYDGRMVGFDDTETVTIRDVLGTRFSYGELMRGL